MTKTKFIHVLLVLLCFGTQKSLAQPKADEKTVTFLNKFRSDCIKGILQKNAQMIAAYYSDNVRVMPEFQKTIFGKANALAYHQSFSQRFDVHEYSREEIEIIDLGSRVVESGLFTMKLKLKSTGQAIELEGKYQNIWNQDNDKLSLVTSAWNHNNRTDFDHHFRFDEIPGVQVAYHDRVPVNSNISFELAALNKLMEVSIIQHDHSVWSQFFTDDVILLANLSTVTRGRKEVDEYLAVHVKDMPVFEHLDIRNDYIDHLGTYVIEYASHVANWRSGERSGVNTGKNIRLWRREADGSLKIFRQIGSYD